MKGFFLNAETGAVIPASASWSTVELAGGEMQTVKHPPGWLARRSAEELAALGLEVYSPAAEPARDMAAVRSAWRATATLSRVQFCIWAKRANLLTEEEAIAAAKGEWPMSFSDALSALPTGIDMIEAQIVWAGTSVVRRNDPVLAVVASIVSPPVSTEALDAAFGWQE